LQEVETQEEAQQHNDTPQHETEFATPSQSAKNGWNISTDELLKLWSHLNETGNTDD
jgi:hypothetical protein